MKQEYEKLTDQQIWDYEEKLKETEVEKQSYISVRIPLEQEYTREVSAINEKLKGLKDNYEFVRRTRRDGNCFYRAVGFSILHHIFKYQRRDDYHTLFINRMELYLEGAGFQKLVYEDYIEMLRESLQHISTLQSFEAFLEFFNQTSIADTIVILLRLTTSAYLRLNSDDFLPFIDTYPNMDEFCTAHVENMGKDADHVHITALSRALDLIIHIIYLDAHVDSHCVVHEFRGESSSIFQPMYLLYRPGHYDILEEK